MKKKPLQIVLEADKRNPNELPTFRTGYLITDDIIGALFAVCALIGVGTILYAGLTLIGVI